LSLSLFFCFTFSCSLSSRSPFPWCHQNQKVEDEFNPRQHEDSIHLKSGDDDAYFASVDDEYENSNETNIENLETQLNDKYDNVLHLGSLTKAIASTTIPKDARIDYSKSQRQLESRSGPLNEQDKEHIKKLLNFKNIFSNETYNTANRLEKMNVEEPKDAKDSTKGFKIFF